MVMIIAECGINHNGSMKLAKMLIDKAYENGADIAKFQLYKTSVYHKRTFEWYNYCEYCELTKDDLKMLKDYCDKVGIEFMTSVFNKEFVPWTEEIGMHRYKIGSRCIHNKELLREIESTGKDMIVSLGFWKKKDLPQFNTTGKVDYLYCISDYPTDPQKIKWDEIDFKKLSGFSDHTIGLESAKKAIDFGARIIEKHFTYDKKMYGPDHSGSMESEELAELVKYAKQKGL